jgi:hypothetical protein
MPATYLMHGTVSTASNTSFKLSRTVEMLERVPSDTYDLTGGRGLDKGDSEYDDAPDGEPDLLIVDNEDAEEKVRPVWD